MNMTDCDNLLTVLLVIKDRPKFTERFLKYADETFFPFKILIADGGRDQDLQNLLSKGTYFRNLYCTYYRYPYDASYKEYYSKVESVLGKVQTPFCVVADDDNFFSVDGLQRAVSFLSQNSDYSACQGYTFGFRLEPTSSHFYGERVSFSKPILNQHYCLENHSAADRLVDFSKKNSTICYAVQRTENMRKIYREINRVNFHDLYITEVFYNFLTVVNGKVCQGKYPFMYRQFNTYNSSCEQASLVADEFDRMLWNTFSDEFGQFVSVLTEAMSVKDGSDIDKACSVVKKAFRAVSTPTIMACLNKNRQKPTFDSVIRRNALLMRIFRSAALRSVPMSHAIKELFFKEKSALARFLTNDSINTSMCK